MCGHSYKVNMVKTGPACASGLFRPETLKQVRAGGLRKTDSAAIE